MKSTASVRGGREGSALHPAIRDREAADVDQTGVRRGAGVHSSLADRACCCFSCVLFLRLLVASLQAKPRRRTRTR